MPQKILIINPFGIGDVLFSTPLIKNLRFYYPDAFIAVAVQKKIAAVLENNPNINKIIPFSRGDFKELCRQSRFKAIGVLLRTIGEVRQHKFDLFIDLSLEHRYSLALKFLGVKQRVGYNYKNRGRFLTHKINIEGYKDKHVVEYHLDLLRFLGKNPKFRNLELHLRQEEKSWAEAFLRENGVSRDDFVVGIIPGGGASWGDKGHYLRWPYENFAKICDELETIPQMKILLFGAKTDVQLCQKITKILKQKPIEVFGKTNLRQFITLLDKCNLVICNDTGPLHISVALEKKIICFCGPVDDRVYGPYPPRSEHIVMKKDFPCRPCYRKFRVPECEYEQRCLIAITVQEVFQEVERLLKI